MSLVRAKLYATGVHFLLSALVLGAVALLLLQLWYPWPLWKILDAPGMLMIAVGVDLIIGPLLTAVVYQPGKRTLKFDLGVIVLLQIAALSFGIHTMAQARPVYVVAVVDRFEVVSAFQLTEKELADGDARWRAFSWTGPRYVGVRPPLPEEQENVFFEAVNGNDVHLRPKFYADFSTSWEKLAGRCKDADGSCELTAHYRGVLWRVLVDPQGRLIEALGVDNTTAAAPSTPPESNPPAVPAPEPTP
ncbi:MAG: hypothetical protein MUE46_17605 [Xanthomonadales bacterium]|jgi:hypothetical protein|nr:hypothetical protein [Xanthomonadales bacterium]